MNAGFSIKIAFFALFLAGFSACERATQELPPEPLVNHVLSREAIGYGVVIVSFSHLLDEPGSGGVSQGHLRRGTVVRIMERRRIIDRGNAELWVLAETNGQLPGMPPSGWLPEAAVEIFDSEPRADTAAKAMLP